MANKTYVPVGGKAKLTRKMYVSVGGKAKPVKRVYVSVGGKAKIAYDTVVVSYVNDNGYTNNTTVSSTERIAKHSHATKKDNKTWYKSDGTVFDFNTAVTSNLTLYEAVYSAISIVTFDGSHYVPTDIKVNRSDMDLSVYPCYCTAATDTTERVVFGFYGTPAVILVKNPSKKWSASLGNNTSNMNWDQGALIAVKQNERSWFRLKLNGSDHFLQTWTDSSSSGNWRSVFQITQNTTNKNFCIGWCEGAPSHWLPFKGTIGGVSTASIGFDCYQRKKGGSTVQGYAHNGTHKFYPLVNAS